MIIALYPTLPPQLILLGTEQCVEARGIQFSDDDDDDDDHTQSFSPSAPDFPYWMDGTDVSDDSADEAALSDASEEDSSPPPSCFPSPNNTTVYRRLEQLLTRTAASGRRLKMTPRSSQQPALVTRKNQHPVGSLISPAGGE